MGVESCSSLGLTLGSNFGVVDALVVCMGCFVEHTPGFGCACGPSVFPLTQDSIGGHCLL